MEICFYMQLERLKNENMSPLLPLDINLIDPSLGGLERTLSQLNMVCFRFYSKCDLYSNMSDLRIYYYFRQMSICKAFFLHLKSFLDLAMPWKEYLLWNLSSQKLSKQRRKQTSFSRGNLSI